MRALRQARATPALEQLEGAAAAAPAAAADAPPKFAMKRARALFSAAGFSSPALRFLAAFFCFEAGPSFAPAVLPMAQSKSSSKSPAKASTEMEREP